MQNSIERAAQSYGLQARIVRQNRHVCYRLSNGTASRLLVVAKTPSDVKNMRNVIREIRKISLFLQQVTIKNGTTDCHLTRRA